MSDPGGNTPAPAIPSDPAAESLRLYLASRDVPCPRCGYNLRGSTSSSCPECGKPLVIAVQRDRNAAPVFFARLVFVWLIAMSLLNGIPLARWMIQSATYESYGAGLRRDWGAIAPTRWHWPTFEVRDWFWLVWTLVSGLIGVFGTLSLLRPGSRTMERRWLRLAWLAAAAFSLHLAFRVHQLYVDW